MLGSFKNFDTKLIDPAKAEEAFLRSARYSCNDFPIEAAQSFLCAGRAAFVQKKPEDALKYSDSAIALNSKLVEAYFQSGQALSVLGRPDEALKYLVTAIVNEHQYSIRAADDGDILRHPKMLEKALKMAKDEYEKRYKVDKMHYRDKIEKLGKVNIGGYVVKKLSAERIKDASRHESDFDSKATSDTIFGYSQASRMAKENKRIISNIAVMYESVANRLINEEIRKLDDSVSAINSTINDKESTINTIDISVYKSKPSDEYSAIDFVFGVPLAIFVYWLIISSIFSNILILIIIILILAALAADEYSNFSLLPFIWPIYRIRKFLWESSSRDAETKKGEVCSHINERKGELAKLNRRISDLKNIKRRIGEMRENLLFEKRSERSAVPVKILGR